MNRSVPETRTDSHRVYSFLCNQEGYLRISSIAQLLQESAWLHAESCGVGYHSLKPLGLLWILYGLKLKIDRMPRWGDRISVKTMGRKYENLFAYRDYFIYDSEDDQNPVITGSSSWLVVDLDSHRPRRITDNIKKIPVMKGDPVAGTPGKLEDSKDFQYLDEIRVPYSDIDIYHHVNNARYIQWCVDSSQELMAREKECSGLDFQFISEAKLKDRIEIMNLVEPDNNIRFKGVNNQKGRDVFLSAFFFEG